MATPVALEADIVIAGGGAAACVIAGRLAKADPELKILVLEQGVNTKENPTVIRPAAFLSHLAPTSKTLSFYVAEKSEHLAGRNLVVPTGHSVGGGSSVNFMMYTRASASDYDQWRDDWNNPGWGAEDLKPLLNKTETYQIDPSNPDHGHSGPLKVSYGGANYRTPLAKAFVEVATKTGYLGELKKDQQELHSSHGFSRWGKWIDEKTGRRSDAAHYFIYNQEDNKNLVVLTGVKVNKIIFEGDRAVGYEYVLNKALDPEADQTPRVARAKKQLVLSAGALGTPAILERSGLGSKSVLAKAGIKQKVDLPGVGENYQDHQLVVLTYLTTPNEETMDDYLRGVPEVHQAYEAQWAKDGGSLLGSNAIDYGSKIRPTEAELKSMGPAFNAKWREFYEKYQDKPTYFMGFMSSFLGDPSLVPATTNYFSVGGFLMYPFSVGHIHVKSDNLYEQPEFNPGLLSDPADIAPHVWAYKKGRELARRMPAFRGELAPAHPKFAENSPAAAKAYPGPLGSDIEDIKYSAEDDAAIEQYYRENVGTTWHSMGTAAMKPREKGGVVDSKLNVYGVSGLKIADMSIAPSNVGANTYSTALVIGEKAAVLIAEELGIRGV